VSGTVLPGTNAAEANTYTLALYDMFVAELGEPPEESAEIWRRIATSIANAWVNILVDSLSDGSVIQVLDGEIVGGSGGQGGVASIAKRTTTSSLSDPNTTETDLIGVQGDGIEIEGDTLLLTGSIRFKFVGTFTVNQNDEGTVTIRVRFGADVLGSVEIDATLLDITTYRFELYGEFGNIVSDQLQSGQARLSIGAEGLTFGGGITLGGLFELFGTVDTETDRDFRVTAQLSADIDAQLLTIYGNVDMVRGF
jgi:hypothetical protein